MINVHNTTVHYIQYGKGEDVILLHGWGQNIAMMAPLGDPLSSKYRVTIIDFPGFGESKEPDKAWTIQDYTSMLRELVEKLHIIKPVVIGHSFGGRIAISYASCYDVSKVVLFGAPCVRTKQGLTPKEKILKSIKKLPGMNALAEKAKNYIGSRDYKAASPIMRQTLVNTVNEDLSDCAKNIKVPTLLIWGQMDTEAPIEEAKLLEKLLKDGALIVLPGTHYAYLENLAQVIQILFRFLEG